MPWRTSTPMSQCEEFIRLVHQRRHPITELCVAFGISEKTGHKWLARFAQEGVAGLADRSHVPHAPPHQLTAAVHAAIITLRERHATWGPRKLRAVLMRTHPDVTWPATSTIGELLRRECMVRGRSPAAPGCKQPARYHADDRVHAECGVDRGLQGRVSVGVRAVLLSADGDGRAESLPARLHRAPVHGHHAHAGRVHTTLSALWPAAGDPERQRRALRGGAGLGAALVAGGLVDSPGDSAGAHCPGAAPAERRA